MANFKFVVSESQTKKSYQFDIDQGRGASIIGKKIGEEFSGDVIGLSGYTLKITGGSDKDGFPMLATETGPGKRRVLLIQAPGFHPKIQGQRKRKSVRGDTISEDTVQINTKVTKAGAQPLEELAPKKAEGGAEKK
jgi:small subunit ribosomal protein S6e